MMHRLFTRGTLLGALLCGGLTACGSDHTDPPTPAETPVLVLADLGWVAFDSADSDAQASNLYLALRESGFPVHAVADVESLPARLAASTEQILVIPRYYGHLTGATTRVIRDWVSSGGRLVVAGNPAGQLDSLLGRQLNTECCVLSGDPEATFQRISGSTALAGGPAELPVNDATHWIHEDSLPGNAAVYQLPNSVMVAVAVWQEGSGKVVFLGWDFWNAAPRGTQDGEWSSLLPLLAGL